MKNTNPEKQAGSHPPANLPVPVTYCRSSKPGHVAVYFPIRPPEATLAQLRGTGFRWDRARRAWVAETSPQSWALAKSLGVPNSRDVMWRAEGNSLLTVSPEWQQALTQIFHGNPPTDFTLDNPADIASVLTYVCLDPTPCVFYLPDGGFPFSVHGAIVGSEPGTIEFIVGDRLHYVHGADKLSLSYSCGHPEDSFFLLESAGLSPLRTTPTVHCNDDEWIRLPNGTYSNPADIEDKWAEKDPHGPSKGDCIYVVRMFGGKLLVVPQESAWEQLPAGFRIGGGHTTLSLKEIRWLITQVRTTPPSTASPARA